MLDGINLDLAVLLPNLIGVVFVAVFGLAIRTGWREFKNGRFLRMEEAQKEHNNLTRLLILIVSIGVGLAVWVTHQLYQDRRKK